MNHAIKLGLAVAFVGAAVVGARAAHADPPPNQAAITLKDKEHPVGCSAFGLQTSDQIHTVSTPSGNTKLVCHFDVPEAQRPKSAEDKSGFACGIFLPGGASKLTTDSSFKMTPGGKAKLECTVKL